MRFLEKLRNKQTEPENAENQEDEKKETITEISESKKVKKYEICFNYLDGDQETIIHYEYLNYQLTPIIDSDSTFRQSHLVKNVRPVINYKNNITGKKVDFVPTNSEFKKERKSINTRHVKNWSKKLVKEVKVTRKAKVRFVDQEPVEIIEYLGTEIEEVEE